MDPRLLDYYERELRHLADICGEFSRDYPKIAGRLSLEGFVREFECPDPYVERLLEGFAYMAARVQLKVDAEFPRFTQHLLDMVYPDYLCPIPSMGIVQFQPDLTQATLNDGAPIARGATLRGLLGKGDQTPCRYRTAHDVTLWPIAVTSAKYLPTTAAIAALGIEGPGRLRAALQLRIATTSDAPFDKIALDQLAFYISGNDPVAMGVYEQLMANVVAVVIQPPGKAPAWRERLARDSVKPIGFGDDEALLPPNPRTFQGYRLLREYFAFPERFFFVGIDGLARGARRCAAKEMDVIVLFRESLPFLEEAVEASRFQLFCTPVINLFKRRADRIALTDGAHEYHVVPDRARPLDYEVYAVTDVEGYGAATEPEVRFQPFYACSTFAHTDERGAYFTLRRQPRRLSTAERQRGPRSSYIGSEAFLALVDGSEAPFRRSLRQLGLDVWCTNRDLPLQMPVGVGTTDLTMEVKGPVDVLRFIAGPTEPRPIGAYRETAWKLISHLALNYLSLVDSNPREGAAALRELLDLYTASGDPSVARQVEGVVSVTSKPIHRRLPLPGPVTVGRGLEVTLTFDDTVFTGTGPFLLGAVLEQFVARYVSINAFTETVLRTSARGEIMRWPARIGLRPQL